MSIIRARFDDGSPISWNNHSIKVIWINPEQKGKCALCVLGFLGLTCPSVSADWEGDAGQSPHSDGSSHQPHAVSRLWLSLATVTVAQRQYNLNTAYPHPLLSQEFQLKPCAHSTNGLNVGLKEACLQEYTLSGKGLSSLLDLSDLETVFLKFF